MSGSQAFRRQLQKNINDFDQTLQGDQQIAAVAFAFYILEPGQQCPDIDSMDLYDIDRLDRGINYLIERTLSKYAGEMKDVNKQAEQTKNSKLQARRNKNK